MSIQAISTVEPKRKNTPNIGVNAGIGAVVGAGLRYIIPTKKELSSMDTFVSSASMNARGAGRSVLKYAGIGALVATALSYLTKQKNDENKENTTIEYTKLGALVDAPDYACEIMWYGE